MESVVKSIDHWTTSILASFQKNKHFLSSMKNRSPSQSYYVLTRPLTTNQYYGLENAQKLRAFLLHS